MIIVLSGSIGRFPVGGHAWINLQYLAGLRALGHEVYYLEDCGAQSWVHVWETDEVTDGLGYPSAYIRQCLEPFGFHGRWIYRAGDRFVGMDLSDFLDVCARAELLIIRAAPLPLWRAEYDWPRRRVFIDVDPGFTQAALSNGNRELTETVERCEHLFTIAQRLGAADCRVPSGGRRWIKTVAPVWLDSWPDSSGCASERFTTIMQWRSYGKSHAYRDGGAIYGQKAEAFAEYLDLPGRTSQKLCIALTGGSPERLAAHGWEVVSGWKTTRTPGLYREFIQESRAELSIAKRGYVSTRSGWFSDRSVCYLASGKPVAAEDTGLGDWLPVGEGLVAFADVQGAVRAIEAVNDDYARHCRAARALAERHFSTERVLPPLLEAGMA